jgi:putative transposase
MNLNAISNRFIRQSTRMRRKVICSTNAIESLNARYRRAVKARGNFLIKGAAIKYLYLVTRSLDPTGEGRVK